MLLIFQIDCYWNFLVNYTKSSLIFYAKTRKAIEKPMGQSIWPYIRTYELETIGTRSQNELSANFGKNSFGQIGKILHFYKTTFSQSEC
jgi:hypothetical protein